MVQRNLKASEMKNKYGELKDVSIGTEKEAVESSLGQSLEGQGADWIVDAIHHMENYSERHGYLDVFKELKVARLRIELCLKSEKE